MNPSQIQTVESPAPLFPVKRIRAVLAIFVAGLVFSGLTAFPLETEIRALDAMIPSCCAGGGFAVWIARVREGLVETNAKFPFIAYGTDWLAFAHLVIAVAFIGPWRDPVRNAWVIDWGIFCCAAIIPLALIAGGVRGIPFGWRLVDCSFGIFGAIPLLLARRWIQESIRHQNSKRDFR